MAATLPRVYTDSQRSDKERQGGTRGDIIITDKTGYSLEKNGRVPDANEACNAAVINAHKVKPQR